MTVNHILKFEFSTEIANPKSNKERERKRVSEKEWIEKDRSTN